MERRVKRFLSAWLIASVLVPKVLVADPATLPLLGDSRVHLYTQRAYEGFGPAVDGAVDQRYAELVAAGMDTARHLFDWRDLEPSPGVYDTAVVTEAMDAAIAAGIANQFANLVTIDSAGPVVPTWVQDLLDAGVSWDDPRITDAFADLLDVFVPLMLERDMFMLGLANEPGGYYEDAPEAAATFKGFVAAATEHAHALEPGLAVTVVFAGTQGPALPELLPLNDVATFNTYFYVPEEDPDCPLAGEPLSLWRSATAERVGEILDELVDAAQGKLINIQEIGQASAGMTLGPRTSETNQAEVYDAFVSALHARRSHFRTVCNWTLNDHDTAWEPLRQGLIDDGLPACYADNIAEIFTLTGLVASDEDATAKPAFDVFRDGVTFFAESGRETTENIDINQGLAGAWFDPTRPGQGVLIDVDPVRRLLFLAWLTYAPSAEAQADEGGQRWYTAQGTYSGNAATGLLLHSTTGGRFDDVSNVVTRRIGRLSMSFEACDTGTLRYTLDEDGVSHIIPLRRLLPEAALLCDTLAQTGESAPSRNP